MEFWGVEVKPGKGLELEPEAYVHISQGYLSQVVSQLLHLVQAAGTHERSHVLFTGSQAALGANPTDGERVVLQVANEGGDPVVLGTLSKGKCDQIHLDLVFDRDFRLFHTGTSSVYFVGYTTPGALYPPLYCSTEQLLKPCILILSFSSAITTFGYHYQLDPTFLSAAGKEAAGKENGRTAGKVIKSALKAAKAAIASRAAGESCWLLPRYAGRPSSLSTLSQCIFATTQAGSKRAAAAGPMPVSAKKLKAETPGKKQVRFVILIIVTPATKGAPAAAKATPSPGKTLTPAAKSSQKPAKSATPGTPGTPGSGKKPGLGEYTCTPCNR
eukprot:SM000075S21967  [mRNA]  locus=s75:379186:382440:+ [translate_table: standard]